MRQFSNRKAFRKAGFTLVELLVSLSVFAAVGTVLFSMLRAGTILFAKNTSINLSHNDARHGIEKLFSLVQTAIAPPILVDASLTAVAGEGPAAGMTFLRFASKSTYTNVNAVTAGATTLRLRRTASMPVPEPGDVLVMVGTDDTTFSTTNVVGFQAPITAVSALSTTDYTVTFGGSVGSFCNPQASSGNVLLQNAKLFMLDRMACVAVDKESVVENGVSIIRSELRLADNASTYSATNPATYRVLSQLIQTGGSSPLPFRYTVPDHHWVDVDLRVESTNYNRRKFDTTNTFFDLKESIANRSAILVSTN